MVCHWCEELGVISADLFASISCAVQICVCGWSSLASCDRYVSLFSQHFSSSNDNLPQTASEAKVSSKKELPRYLHFTPICRNSVLKMLSDEVPRTYHTRAHRCKTFEAYLCSRPGSRGSANCINFNYACEWTTRARRATVLRCWSFHEHMLCIYPYEP